MASKILVFGSINIDNVYMVAHFPRPGEVIDSLTYSILAGGKGANQTVALHRAGMKVALAGKIGQDGVWVKDILSNIGVDTSDIQICEIPTGHAVIQLTENGQNTITVFLGANRTHTKEEIDAVLGKYNEGDFLLLQNEINLIDYLIDKAHQKGMKVILNPAPYTDEIKNLDFHKIFLLFINPFEGYGITGKKLHQNIIDELVQNYPELKVVLTLGKLGAFYKDKETILHTPARQVTAIDHTGAGDTFVGFFLASYLKEKSIEECMRVATVASSICIQRVGAIDSIPYLEEVEKCLSPH